MDPRGVLKETWDFRKGSFPFKGGLMIAKFRGWVGQKHLDMAPELNWNQNGLGWLDTHSRNMETFPRNAIVRTLS